MKKKIIFIIIVTVFILIGFYLFSYTRDRKIINDNLFLELENDIYVVSNVDNISFTEDSYQNDIDNLIFNKKNDKLYKVDSPLLVFNPYGTNTTGLYIYFYTFPRRKIEYTISINDKDIPDFTNTLPDGLSFKHEGQIIGLIQGMDNTITLKEIDRNNNIKKEYSFKINVPDFNTSTIKKIDSEILVDEDKISDGLYMVSNIRNSEVFESVPLSFYDRYGVLRAEFTRQSGNHTNRPIFIDDNFFYAITNYDYALVNKLGKIVKYYHTDYKNDHDYFYDKDKKLLLYINNTDNIRGLNLETGEDKLLLDLNVFIKDYRDDAIKYYKENYNKDDDNIDWIHLNSLEVIDKNDLIISLRENSSIMYISNIYTDPEIKYIIGPNRIYEGTNYEKYLLKQVGDFPIHAGQHTVIYEEGEDLDDNKYYLYMYNNNYAKSNAVVNDDWIYTIDGVGTNKKKVDYSMYYKYLIDEEKKTFSLVDSFNVPYSNTKSNVQKYNDNYIVTSGKVGIIGEYNMDKELLVQLKIDVYNDIYRAYKCDMKGYWFGNSYRYTSSVENNKIDSDKTEEINRSDFYYSKRTNTILGINSKNENSSESDIIYYNNIYFTIYEYKNDSLVVPSNIDGVDIKKITGINYSNVKKIVIEEGIEEIGDYAFLGCSSLEVIVLPSTLKSIGDNAFIELDNIKEISIPESVTYIGSNAFKGWESNQTIKVIKNWDKFSEYWKNNNEAKIKLGE